MAVRLLSLVLALFCTFVQAQPRPDNVTVFGNKSSGVEKLVAMPCVASTLTSVEVDDSLQVLNRLVHMPEPYNNRLGVVAEPVWRANQTGTRPLGLYETAISVLTTAGGPLRTLKDPGRRASRNQPAPP
jgi:hypothetical protein